MMALKQCYSSANNKKSEDKSHQYWAKGTGFGTGSTTQSWNVEQSLCRKRFEEEHVTVFLQVRLVGSFLRVYMYEKKSLVFRNNDVRFLVF